MAWFLACSDNGSWFLLFFVFSLKPGVWQCVACFFLRRFPPRPRCFLLAVTRVVTGATADSQLSNQSPEMTIVPHFKIAKGSGRLWDPLIERSLPLTKSSRYPVTSTGWEPLFYLLFAGEQRERLALYALLQCFHFSYINRA